MAFLGLCSFSLEVIALLMLGCEPRVVREMNKVVFFLVALVPCIDNLLFACELISLKVGFALLLSSISSLEND
jgi:hypothetical protein